MRRLNLWSLLGLVGLIGLAGLFTRSSGLFGFFGFFGFFSLAARRDERLDSVYARAGRNGFAAGVIGACVLVLLMALRASWAVVAAAVAGQFAAPILTFVVSAVVYDRRGD